jgi:hypothetical protein
MFDLNGSLTHAPWRCRTRRPLGRTSPYRGRQSQSVEPSWWTFWARDTRACSVQLQVPSCVHPMPCRNSSDAKVCTTRGVGGVHTR